MKNRILSIMVLAGTIASMALSAEERVVVTPRDTKEALVNPGMGWVLYFYSNVPQNYGSKLSPSDTVDNFPGLSTVYLRIPWAYIEPEEGRFNWAILDTPAQRWISKGKHVAFRITCSEDWEEFATPKWVKEAGAKGKFYQFSVGRETKAWDPLFDDPVFLEKLEDFFTVFAARYDGNPNVEFVDIGTYGLWGEGHTFMSSKQDSFKLKKLHIDLHLKYFKKTQLSISDDFVGHDKPGARFPLTDYALSQGVSLRDDSILVQPQPNSWYHAEMAQAFWPVLPVVLEHEHYAGSKVRGAWDGNLLLKAIEEYHASYMSIHFFPRQFLQENRETIDKINLRMGYRLLPVKVSWPASVEIGKWFKVRWTWANKGVAPCLPGGFPTLTLKDAKGGLVSVLVDDTFDLRNLKVGKTLSAPVQKLESEFAVGLIAPVTKPGTYDVFVSIGARDGTPKIALPLEGDDGQHRYHIGSIKIIKGKNE